MKGCVYAICAVLVGCSDSPRLSVLSSNTIDSTQSDRIECQVHVEEFRLEVTIRDEKGTQHVLIPDSEIVKMPDTRVFFVIPLDERNAENAITRDYLIIDDTTILVSAMDFKYRTNTYVVFKDPKGMWNYENLKGSSMLNGSMKLDCECSGVFVVEKERIVAVHTSPIPFDEALDRSYVNVLFYEIGSNGFKYLESIRLDDCELGASPEGDGNHYESELYFKANQIRSE